MRLGGIELSDRIRWIVYETLQTNLRACRLSRVADDHFRVRRLGGRRQIHSVAVDPTD